MRRRCGNADGKNPAYIDVELRITEELWLEWAVPRYEAFLRARPTEVPCVSRNGDQGHYEFGNIQVLSVAENRALQKSVGLLRADGRKRCGMCRRELTPAFFSKNRCKPDGLAPRCKECVSAVRRTHELEERMKIRDPLDGLTKIWGEVRELERKAANAKKRAEREIGRLARNKHRQEALRRIYWDELERLSVQRIGELFRIPTLEVAARAGELGAKTSCLLCHEDLEVVIRARSHRRELEAESGVNPKHRICGNCTAFRDMDLELLRKKPGEKLTPAHRAAYSRYLKTPQWKERRARALKRAKHKCSLCSKKHGLECHHRSYERIGQERPEDLIIICSSCHGTHHGH